MPKTIAITRAISPRFNECELTHLQRAPIDLALAHSQHRQYEDALRALGLEVISLPAMADLPDSVFIEDTALVLDEVAVLTRPGADSRKAEVDSIAEALAPYRRLIRIEAPGSVDGGDILRLGKTIHVGLSTRSNQSAIQQMQSALGPYGYTVRSVPVTGCLHLKSAVTQAGEDTLLINPAWVEKSHFPGWKLIEVDPREPSAANIVLTPGGAIYPQHFPLTQARLSAAGIRLTIVPATEVAKAEGAVTCCSLIFSA
ncbi:MAG: dimethylargininase [Chloroflexi bacterium HGW-Chloroflexi-6]|nr:MAG: dimethylargininase [Chloroflexi bacterium HGW-Chloroflexi-6]